VRKLKHHLLKRRCEKIPVADKSKLGQNSRPGNSSHSSRFCLREAWTAKEIMRRQAVRRARHRLHQCARRSAGDARMSAQVTCHLIQREAGIEAVLHFCCRDRNMLGIQSTALAPTRSASGI
jgi:homocysteine S-methyltransferase